MICGWIGDHDDAEAVVGRMARALTVEAAQRHQIHQVSPSFAIGLLDVVNTTDAVFDSAAAVSRDGQSSLWMAGEAYDGGSLCEVPSVAASRRRLFREELLAALLVRGVDALASLDGRYVIVWHDARAKTVTIATDRFGGVPVYWTRTSRGVAFAGGVRGVLVAPGVPCEPDVEAIREAVTFGGFRLGTRTNVRGVQRLDGASVMTIGCDVTARRYWQWPSAASAKSSSALGETVEQAAALWKRAIRLRLTDARRPGQTLSGGLDSRAILAEGASQAASWAALTYGLPGCDDAKYAEQAATQARATWIFDPLYSGGSPDWLDRRTSYIQQTDGLMQLGDLMHCESLHRQRELFDVHLSGYIGDVVCGTNHDAIVDAATLLAKLPYSGVAIAWPWERAVAWANEAVEHVKPAAARFAMYEHKFPQAIHLIFQASAPYLRVRTPFTDYQLFDFFSGQPPEVRAVLHCAWLAGTYPQLFSRIADQRTGVPMTAGSLRVAAARGWRGARRAAARALRAVGLPAPVPRIRAYHDEETYWSRPDPRRRIEATICRPGSIVAEIFGRPALQKTLENWFDRRIGPVQVIGALYTFEAYFRDLPASLATIRC